MNQPVQPSEVVQNAAPAPAPAQNPAPQQQSQTPGLSPNATPEEVLRYNPFASKGANVAPDGGNQPKSGSEQNPAQTQTAQVPPTASNQTDPSVLAIQQFLAASEAQQQGRQPQQDQPQENPFAVNWQLPGEVGQALFSGEPEVATQALNHIVNGTANGVLSVVQQRLGEMMQQFIPALIQQQIEANTLNQLFYARHAHLDKQELRPVIGKAAAALAQHYRSLGRQVNPRDPAFMDAVENYMVAQGLVVRPQQQQPQQVQQQQSPYFGTIAASPAGGGQAPVDRMKELGL